jgi:hypothetical protein
MAYQAITPLTGTDTFQTWFNTTNTAISALNGVTTPASTTTNTFTGLQQFIGGISLGAACGVTFGNSAFPGLLTGFNVYANVNKVKFQTGNIQVGVSNNLVNIGLGVVNNQNNCYFGQNTGISELGSEYNTYIGPNSGYSDQNGIDNVGVGFNSSLKNLAGGANTAVGSGALLSNASSSSNVALGYTAGSAAVAPTNSIFIGANSASKDAAGYNYEIVIGADVTGLGNNTLVLGNAATITGTRIAGVISTAQTATTLSSSATITPTLPIHFVSGTTTISTITAPFPISTTGGQITLIPTGLWSTNTAGNIALATTAVVNKALTMTYNFGTSKWYPSY